MLSIQGHPHPSEFIEDEMNERGWTRPRLARAMGGDIGKNLLALDLYFIVGPGNKRCRLGDGMAHQLSNAFGVSKDFFLNLEAGWIASQT